MNKKDNFYETSDIICVSQVDLNFNIIHNQGILLNKLNEILKLIKEKHE